MTPSADYRPQWFSPTPAGYRDEVFHYAFDGSNTPGLATAIALGFVRENIPLPLQAGSEFVWRAYAVFSDPDSVGVYSMRFKDPFGNYLSAGYVAMDLYAYPSCLMWTGYSAVSKVPIPLEPEIVCPSAGLVTIDLACASGSSLQKVGVVLYGLKRVKV